MMENSNIQDLQKPVGQLKVSFVKLTEPFRPALWKYCHKLTRNALDAEDLVQDTMLRAFSKLGYLGQALNPRAYLFRMATNIWIKQQQHSQEVVDLQSERHETSNDTEGQLPYELGEMMDLLVHQLNPKQRVAFILSSCFDLSNKEIADMLATTEGTIKSYLHRSRVALSAAIENGALLASRTTVVLGQTDNPVLQKYIHAFNNGDVAALLALIDENATTRIHGDWVEFGKDQIANNSLHYWSLEKVQRVAAYGLVDGTPVVFGFRKDAKGELYLREIIRIVSEGELIQTIDWHYFSVDLLKYAANILGMPLLVEGYQFDSSSKKVVV